MWTQTLAAVVNLPKSVEIPSSLGKNWGLNPAVTKQFYNVHCVQCWFPAPQTSKISLCKSISPRTVWLEPVAKLEPAENAPYKIGSISKIANSINFTDRVWFNALLSASWYFVNHLSYRLACFQASSTEEYLVARTFPTDMHR